MARRIEIELTSQLDGGQFTWRAAGAREPRGTLDATLLDGPASVGDVLRAEVESGLDGVEVVSIVPRKAASPLNLRGELLERQPEHPQVPAVSVTYAGGRRGEPKGDGPRRRPSERPRGAERSSRPDGRGRSDRPRPRRDAEGHDRRDARTGEPRAPRDDARGRGRPPAPSRGTGRTRGPEVAATTVHRNALLATLGPEQLPIAEQLLRGGIPAVRQAIDEQNRSALAQGKPTVAPETILDIAEGLLPLTALAAWKDRAAAVQQAGQSVRLRDLRPVVTSARAVALDEPARAVLKELQGLLHTKSEELRTQWVSKIESLLGRSEVVEALHVASRPPDSSARCPAQLATALAQAAGAAMTDELTATGWIAILDAVVASPVRRLVHPAGIPAAEEARAAAVKAAGHVPALAKLLGMRIPPPPPASPRRPAVSARRSS